MDGNSIDIEKLAGPTIRSYKAGPKLHPGFGELSLMYGKSRSASVIARTDGKLWSLQRSPFRRLVLRPKDHRQNILRCLRMVKLFTPLKFSHLQRLSELVTEVTYSKGDFIVKQGEMDNRLHVVESGQCRKIKHEEGEEIRFDTGSLVKEVKLGDYFGEQNLLGDDMEHRITSVYASADTTKVLSLDKASFEKVLGSLTSIIETNNQWRNKLKKDFQSIKKMHWENTTKTDPIHSLDDIKLIGCVSTDCLGSFILGGVFSGIDLSSVSGRHLANSGDDLQESKNFNKVSVRSFIFKKIESVEQGSKYLRRYIEAIELLSSEISIAENVLIPQQISAFIRDPGAVHFLLDVPLVSDLSVFVSYLILF